MQRFLQGGRRFLSVACVLKSLIKLFVTHLLCFLLHRDMFSLDDFTGVRMK